MKKETLEKKFKSARYFVKNSGIYIHIGNSNPEIDAILEDYEKESWAFITAWNPQGQSLPKEENLERQIQLLLEIKDYILMEGRGESPDGTWYEDSFLILGINKKEALAIADKFDQAAILYGEYRQKAELVFL